jgi:CitMHS family citrate-Mg2+:H+ or citrate-Ca2+:H+ symporter
MLTVLAYLMVGVFMAAIMTNRLSALIALIVIPIAFAAMAGFTTQIPDMAIDGLKTIVPTAVLMLFAILYFGLMIDVGLFDPLVRFVVRICHGDPVRVIVGSTILAMVVSLDGDGSTTYMICVTAMMPLHRRLGINPMILPAVTMLPNSILNIAPWGGPTVRVMSSLKLSPSDVFVPLAPTVFITCLAALGIAYYLGLTERRRLGLVDIVKGGSAPKAGSDELEDVPVRAVVDRPVWLQRFNLALTVSLMAVLVLDIMPLALLFMLAFAIALTVNFPKVRDQRARIDAHSSNVMNVVSVIFAAGVFTGVLSGTGMTDALAKSVIYIIPDGGGRFLPLMTAFLSMPFTFFLSNDAFYFGVVPVLAKAAQSYGIGADVIARASLLGQPVHQLSPLVGALYVLIGLSKVELGAHQRFSLKWSVLLCAVMFVSAGITGAVPWF